MNGYLKLTFRIIGLINLDSQRETLKQSKYRACSNARPHTAN